ncbi:purple acid phosphatase family protein [Chryseosolibacter indicus]|uniref:acid phosphatase n=1 Tax=Chryseosolibacter indicus TaxID=2782351 RepID=A0ABS5VU19_9BACT|nr:tartrate-resistant acid phosphatase type 5 family protein [Chryseosolibacter indicus]MBT1703486.1 metallophosphoesterase [Chryseosolibacter indicus]
MSKTLLKITVAITLSLISIILTAQTTERKGTALKTNPQAVNFIVMGDWGRNGEDHQKQVAAQMGKTASEASVDFIIATGDNFYPLGVASEYDPLWKYSFEDIYTAFSLQWDWYPVLGNHDYGANPEAQVNYSKISRRWRMPSRYYSKQISINGDTTQQILFAFIDTVPLIKGYYNGNGHHVHDQDSTAQKLWLEKVLSTTSPNIKWKIVVGHHPMFTGGGRTESHDTRSIRSVLQPLLEKYNVDAYVAGHEHSLQHMIAENKVHHFISGAASERTPVKMLPISKFALSDYGFMLFSVTPQKLLVQVVDHKGNIRYVTELPTNK